MSLKACEGDVVERRQLFVTGALYVVCRRERRAPFAKTRMQGIFLWEERKTRVWSHDNKLKNVGSGSTVAQQPVPLHNKSVNHASLSTVLQRASNCEKTLHVLFRARLPNCEAEFFSFRTAASSIKHIPASYVRAS